MLNKYLCDGLVNSGGQRAIGPKDGFSWVLKEQVALSENGIKKLSVGRQTEASSQICKLNESSEGHLRAA